MTDQRFNDLIELHNIACAAAYALKCLDGKFEFVRETPEFTHEDVAGCVYSIKRSINMLDQMIKAQGLEGDWLYPEWHPETKSEASARALPTPEAQP